MNEEQIEDTQTEPREQEPATPRATADASHANSHHVKDARHAKDAKDARWRLFCAIELPEEIRSRAGEHAARLRERMPDVRASWERPEKIHLTLKFFGDVERTRIHALASALERAARRLAPFDLRIAGAGAFPTKGNPRVLWLGLQDSSGQLTRLYHSIEDECAAAGFKREERAFHPHITLTRLRHPNGARQLGQQHTEAGFAPMDFTATNFVLIHSQLSPGGSRYTVLNRHELSG